MNYGFAPAIHNAEHSIYHHNQTSHKQTSDWAVGIRR